MSHGIRPECVGEHVAVEALTFYPGNARMHDDDLLAESLATHGQYKPIVAQRSTGHVLVGNGTLHNAMGLSWSHVAVQWLDVDDATARKIVLVDNRASDRGRDDEGLLAALLADLDGDWLGTGFEPDDLAQLLIEADEPLDLSNSSPGPSLADRFGVPPFSVLDARRGTWRARKREWLSLGIESELGRGDDLLGGLAGQGGGGMSDQLAPRSGRTLAQGQQAHRDPRTGELVYTDMPATAAVSIFDPVLCELVYRWFSAEGHHVLDPWAGGSVRGIIASRLGRRYTGVELRGEQVAANVAQLGIAREDPAPVWIEGESAELLRLMPRAGADLIFGCPPYYDLERYSDDPRDLSTLSHMAFDAAMHANIEAAAHVLRPDSFAVFVVGAVRHKSGRLLDMRRLMISACEAAGLQLYNDAVLITPAGSLPVRAGRAFVANRVLGRTHQEVLVFVKGDRKKAAARCGEVDVAAALDAVAADNNEQEDGPYEYV